MSIQYTALPNVYIHTYIYSYPQILNIYSFCTSQSKGKSSNKELTSKKQMEGLLGMVENGREGGMEWSMKNVMANYNNLPVMANTYKKTELVTDNIIMVDNECPAFVQDDFVHVIKNDKTQTHSSSLTAL